MRQLPALAATWGAARRATVLAALCLAAGTAAAPPHAGTNLPESPIAVVDDQGRLVRLPRPARRAVTLAPHATEFAWVAGAGGHVVATVSASDWPPQARALPRVGDGLQPDPERIAVHRPDLVIGWKTGRLDPAASALAGLGIPLYVSAPRHMADIPAAVRAYGRLFGTEAIAGPAADALQRRLDALQARSRPGAPLRVFIQAGSDPIYTVNGEHILSDALRLCGAVNVFAGLRAAAPRVGLEGVIAAQPDVIVAASPGAGPRDAQAAAKAAERWTQAGLPAALARRVHVFDPDLLHRPGPRLVDAAEQLCEVLDAVRAQR